jgi:hypothetical protein
MVSLYFEDLGVNVTTHIHEDDAGYWGALNINHGGCLIFMDRDGFNALADAAAKLANDLKGHRYAKVPVD